MTAKTNISITSMAGLTKNPDQTINGTGTAGDSVVVFEGTTLLGATIVGSDGTWSEAVSLSGQGVHSISVQSVGTPLAGTSPNTEVYVQGLGGLLSDSAGNLYGTTFSGGSGGFGTVFQLSGTDHQTLTTLVNFDGSNGANPYHNLRIDGAGNIFGATGGGNSFILHPNPPVFMLSGADHHTFTTLVTSTLVDLSALSGESLQMPSTNALFDQNGNFIGTYVITFTTDGPSSSNVTIPDSITFNNNTILGPINSITIPNSIYSILKTNEVFELSLSDGPSSNIIYTLDTVAPTITPLAQTSNNALATVAKAGDIITQSFTSTDTVISVLINAQEAAIVHGLGDNYTASYTVQADDTNGATDIVVSAHDEAGNTTTQNIAGVVNVDTVAPTVTHISELSNNSRNEFAKAGDVITETFTSTDTVASVLINGQAATVVQGLGNNYTATYTVQAGDMNGMAGVVITAFDAAGNTTTETAASSVVVDTIAPTVAISSVGRHTFQASQTITGTGEVGGTINVLDGSTVIGTTIVGLDGTWSEQITLSGSGTHSITASGTDRVGNFGVSSDVAYMLDVAPTITSLGGLTNQTSQLISGTGAAGSIVTVMDGTNVLGTAVVAADGNWSDAYTLNGQGAHSITAMSEGTAIAPTVTSLVMFDGQNGQGMSLITDSAGKIYGTTTSSVFEITGAEHQTFNTLATFNPYSNGPIFGELALDASGNLFGTIKGGFGGDRFGTVFELSGANHEIQTTVLRFSGENGSAPLAGVFADHAGNIFGTTADGGINSDGVDPNSGFGTVFQVGGRYVPSLVNFNNGINGSVNNGAEPFNLVFDAEGTMYGTTAAGGQYGNGILFELTGTSHETLTTLFNFNGSNGSFPAGSLVLDPSGNIYGTTASGGRAGYGTAFKLSGPNHDILTTLVDFDATTGQRPFGLVSDSAGNLYGATTYLGGTNGAGIVFELSGSNHQTLTTLFNFSSNGSSGPYNSSGPYDLAIDGADNLYVIMAGGGTYGAGGVLQLSGLNQGKETASSQSVAFSLDTIAPTITPLLQTSNNALATVAKTGDIITQSFTSTDTVTSVLIDGQAATVVRGSGDNYTATYTVQMGSTNGLADVTITAQDLAGNITTSIVPGSVTLDTEAPIINVLSQVSSNLVSTVAKAGDVITEVFTTADIVAKVMINGHVASVEHGLGDTYTAAYTVPVDAINGRATVSIVARDSAGNETISSAVGTVTVDTSAAAVTIQSPGGLTNNVTQVIAGTAEAGSVVSILDGTTRIGTVTANANGTWSQSIALSGQGEHVISASTDGPTVFTTLMNLDSRNIMPYGGLVMDQAGNLYGTTAHGGLNGAGTVFKLSGVDHQTLTTLVSFDGSNGKWPLSTLLSDEAGNLYGTTLAGGSNNYGTVFQLSGLDHQTLTTLVNFNNDNGLDPEGKLFSDSLGNLYGTTHGGGLNGHGTVFELSGVNHQTFTTLVHFDFMNGAYPVGGLVSDSAGNLFGATKYGGLPLPGSSWASAGTIFELSGANHETLTTLVQFNGANGGNPYSGLIIDETGNLYGTTALGGTYGPYVAGGSSGYGTVYELSGSNHQTLNTLASFNGTNGRVPIGALVMDSTGNLYGSTAYGEGESNLDGTVFELSGVDHQSLTTLVNFNPVVNFISGGPAGGWPYSELLSDGLGNLYGTNLEGGIFGAGTVFKLNLGFDQSSTTTYTLDTIAPTITALSQTSNNALATVAKTGDIITQSFTSTDTVTSVLIDGQAATVVRGSGDNYSATYTVQIGSTNGLAAANITALDAAGNPASVSLTGNVTIDTVAPTITHIAERKNEQGSIDFSIKPNDTYWSYWYGLQDNYATQWRAPSLVVGESITDTSILSFDATGLRYDFNSSLADGIGDRSNAAGVIFPQSGGSGVANVVTLNLPNGVALTDSASFGALLIGNPELGWKAIFSPTVANGLNGNPQSQVSRAPVSLAELFGQSVASGTQLFFTYNDLDNGNSGTYQLSISSSDIGVDDPSTTVAKAGDLITETFTSTDTVTSVLINGKDASVVHRSGDNYSASYTVQTGDTNGAANIVITARDAAGNSTTQNIAGSVTVDTVSPLVTHISELSNNASTTLAKAGDIITESFTSTDTVTSVLINGQAATIVHGLGNNYTATYAVQANALNGLADVIITANDLASNATTSTIAGTVRVDTQASTLSIASAGGSINTLTQALVGSGVPGETVKVFDGTTQIGTSTVLSNGVWVDQVVLSGGQGIHNISSTTTDAAGNVGTSNVIQYNLNLVAPLDNALFNTGEFVTAGMTDPNWQYSYSIDSQTFTGNAVVLSASSFGFGYWPTDAGSQWISTNDSITTIPRFPNANIYNIPVTYSTQFSLPVDSSSSATLNFSLHGDDHISGIQINGINVPVPVSGTGTLSNVLGYVNLAQFVIPNSNLFTFSTVVINYDDNYEGLDATLSLSNSHAPVITHLSELSNNLNSTSLAKAGDVITESFTSTDTVTGVLINGQAATVFHGLGNNYTATYSVQANAMNGLADVIISAKDLVGNTISNSVIGSVTVDTIAPTVSILSTGGLTRVATQTIAGTGEAGTVVTLLDGFSTLGTTTVGVDGTWSKLVTLSNQSVHSIMALDSDAAGNSSYSAAVLFDIETSSNHAPTVNGPLTSTSTVRTQAFWSNLLAGASDADAGDHLSVTGLTYTVNGGASSAQAPSGIQLVNNQILVDSSNTAFSNLTTGQADTIVASYTIADDHGGSVAQTNTIVIGGPAIDPMILNNHAPTVAAPLATTFSKGSQAFWSNLLSGAADVDANNTLSVTDLRFSVAGAASTTVAPTGIQFANNQLLVDPNSAAFRDLTLGQTETIVASYNISDGYGGAVAQTNSLTVTGVGASSAGSVPNSSPSLISVAAALQSTSTAGTQGFWSNLLAGATNSNPNAHLDVANLRFSVNNSASTVITPVGIQYANKSIMVDPNNTAFRALAAGQSETIVAHFDIVDGSGSSVAQTDTIIINGQGSQGDSSGGVNTPTPNNHAPEVSAPVTAQAGVHTSAFWSNMLAGATDSDVGNQLHVSNVLFSLNGGVAVASAPTGIQVVNDQLLVDPNSTAFNHLGVGQADTIVASYNVIDGHGGSVAQTDTVTISGPVATVANGTITGTANHDILLGTSGNDTFLIGAGADTITGGRGADVFKYTSLSNSPTSSTAPITTITDFSSTDGDRVDVSAILNGTSTLNSTIHVNQTGTSNTSLSVTVGGVEYYIANVPNQAVSVPDAVANPASGATLTTALHGADWTTVVDVASSHGAPSSVTAAGTATVTNAAANPAGDWTAVVQAGAATVDTAQSQVTFAAAPTANAVSIQTADTTVHEVSNVTAVVWHI